MVKHRMNVTVDWDIYLALKSMDINVSESVNGFLNHLVGSSEVTGEEAEKEQELRILREKQSAILEQISKTASELSAIRARDDREWQEQRARSKEIRDSGIMRELMLRD